MAQDFPPYPKLTFVVDPLFPKEGTRDFVGSIKKEVITEIRNLRCANNCGKFLIRETEEDPPKTGYCGHLFCTGCAIELYRSIGEVKSTGETGGPRLIDDKKFEIYCEPLSEFSLYKCEICKSFKQDENNQKIRLFSDNIMLRDLYKALKCYDGFLCVDCEEGSIFHPKFNSLHCVTCSEGKNKKQYVCVWDIDKHLKNHEGHDLRIMEDKKNDEVHKEEHRHGLNLSSLDRKQREVFAALYHCACCSTSLEKDGGARHLECGHLIGARCVKNAREKMLKRMEAVKAAYRVRDLKGEVYDLADPSKNEGSDVQGLFCNFCKKDPVSKSDLNVYPSFPPFKSKLFDIILGTGSDFLAECSFDCKKCDFKACKTLFGNRHEQTKGRCQWCKVQHLLDRRDCKGK